MVVWRRRADGGRGDARAAEEGGGAAGAPEERVEALAEQGMMGRVSARDDRKGALEERMEGLA